MICDLKFTDADAVVRQFADDVVRQFRARANVSLFARGSAFGVARLVRRCKAKRNANQTPTASIEQSPLDGGHPTIITHQAGIRPL